MENLNLGWAMLVAIGIGIYVITDRLNRIGQLLDLILKEMMKGTDRP